MNKISRQIRTRFGPRVRFDVPALHARDARTQELDRLKDRLVAQLAQSQHNPAQVVRLRQAADDAAAVVFLTPFPLLLLPTLLEEKARAALVQGGRQAVIRRRSATLLTEAA